MKIKLATAATVIALGFAVGSAQASVIENWESPVLPAGTSSASLPASWSVFSNNGSIDVVNSTTLLTAPAGGHQYLDLSGANTGVDLVTGINVSANTTYTLSAAIGDPSNTGDRSWSIQLWAGSVGGGGTFIGQQYSSNVGSTDPANNWVLDSFSFNSGAAAGYLGQPLVIFLNNYKAGTSAYDNILLTGGVPEPATWAMMLVGFGGLGAVLRSRRKLSGAVVA